MATTNEFTLTQTQTQPGADSLAFADADGCAVWLRALPLTNIPKHYEAVLGQLKRLSEADFAPRERARIAEVMREPVMFLHTELARRYAGKPQPAADREREAFLQALALWQALWGQYSACLKPLLENDPDLQGVKAKVLQRGLWVGKQMILVHGLARHIPAPAVWQELHAYYRLAEILECAVTRGDRRTDAECGRRVVLFDLLPRAAARPRGSLRDVGTTDRIDRSLAGHVGAQSIPVRPAARNRGPGDHHRPRRPGRCVAGTEWARVTQAKARAMATRRSSRPACAAA